jgi:hypothetical protein
MTLDITMQNIGGIERTMSKGDIDEENSSCHSDLAHHG